MEFMLDVNGKDLIVRVTAFKPETVCMRRGHPDTWWPDEPAEIEFEVIDDFDGDAIEIDLSRKEIEEIEDQILFWMSDAFQRD